jgi:hypothetical protein
LVGKYIVFVDFIGFECVFYVSRIPSEKIDIFDAILVILDGSLP